MSLSNKERVIRVLFINIPNLLSEMIKGIIGSCADMEIVGEHIMRSGIARQATTARADIVILAGEGPATETCEDVLYRRPRLKIVAISADGRRGFVYKLQPCVEAIGEISAESLIAAIRGGMSAVGRE